MWILTALLAAALAADVKSALTEVPGLTQESTERQRLLAEAKAILKKPDPLAKQIFEASLARLRKQGIAIPDEVPTVYPRGEINEVEGNSRHRVGDDVESKFVASVQITEPTINRFLIEATIRDSSGVGANAAVVGERVDGFKTGVGSGFIAKKPGKYERIFILSARSLKTGDFVVLDVAKQSYEILPAE